MAFRSSARPAGVGVQNRDTTAPRRSAFVRAVMPPYRACCVAARGGHPLTHNCCRFAGASVGDRLNWQSRHRHDQVQAISQGTGNATSIRGDLSGSTPARAAVIAEKSARTGIHGGYEHEASGKHRRARCPGDGHTPFLERLSEDLEDSTVELRHLVQEQHAVVRKGDFTRPWNRTAARKRDVRDSVMRCAKGTRRQQPRTCGQRAGDRMNSAALECLVERQRRQDAAQPPC